MTTFTLNDYHSNNASQILDNYVTKDSLKAIDLDSSDLNTVLETGLYKQTNDAFATLANNYPKANMAGMLYVTKSTDVYSTQEYITISGSKYHRLISLTTQTDWVMQVNASLDGILQPNQIPNLSTIEGSLSQLPRIPASLSTLDLNVLNTKEHCGFYIQDTDSLAVLSSNYPTPAGGSLYVQSLGSDDIMQTYYARGDDERYFVRAYSAGFWGLWISNITQHDLANLATDSDIASTIQAANDYTDNVYNDTLTDINTLKTNVSANTTTITSNTNDIDTLKSTASKQATLLTTLASDVSQNTANIVLVNNKVSTNTTAIAELDAKISSAGGGYTASDIATSDDINNDTPEKIIDANNINDWFDIKRSGLALDKALDLSTSKLNDINTTGIYIQRNRADATVSNNYPVNHHGFLVVVSELDSTNTLKSVQTYYSFLSSVSYSRVLATNGTWYNWEQSSGLTGYAKTVDFNGQIPNRHTALSNGSDLNTVTDAGFYTFTSATNTPIPSLGSGSLLVLRVNNTSRNVLQLAFKSADINVGLESIYFRTILGSKISPWANILTNESNLDANKLVNLDKATALSGSLLRYPKALTTHDLDTIKYPSGGFCSQPDALSATLARNYPVLEEGFLTSTGQNGYAHQTYVTYKTNRMFTRSYDGGVWTPWVEMISAATVESRIAKLEADVSALTGNVFAPDSDYTVLTNNRVVGVPYTNDTGYAILVNVFTYRNGYYSTIEFYINDVLVHLSNPAGNNTYARTANVTVLVPAGAVYRVEGSVITLDGNSGWCEYRSQAAPYDTTPVQEQHFYSVDGKTFVSSSQKISDEDLGLAKYTVTHLDYDQYCALYTKQREQNYALSS